MLFLAEHARVEEAADWTPARDQRGRFTQNETDDFEKDDVDEDCLWLEVEDLGDDGSKGSESNAKEQGPKRDDFLIGVIFQVQRLGDKLQRSIELDAAVGLSAPGYNADYTADTDLVMSPACTSTVPSSSTAESIMVPSSIGTSYAGGAEGPFSLS